LVGRAYNRAAAGPASAYLTMENSFPDIGSMRDEELKALIAGFAEEEHDVSYRRPILHGRTNILLGRVPDAGEAA
jgi:hypothetical protein